MLKFIAKRYAKAAYVFRQEQEAATNDLNAGLALRNAEEKRSLVAQLTKEAEAMDARIKEVETNLEKGFYECDEGHESILADLNGAREWVCLSCGKPVRFIERSTMTGQEKYESDRERKDAEDLAKSKRDQAKAEEENAAQSEKTAKYFQTLAAQNRQVAEKIRRL